MGRRQRDVLALLAAERDGLRQERDWLLAMLDRERLEVERARRAGTWPAPLPDVRRQVDREENERRGAELTAALTRRMEIGVAQLAAALFAPRRPQGPR